MLVGAGKVEHVSEPLEFRANGPGPVPTMAWEHSVQRSIRPGSRANGFLLPYHEGLELAEQDDSLDLEQFVAFAPEEHFDEFAYGSELAGHEAAIGALLTLPAE